MIVYEWESQRIFKLEENLDWNGYWDFSTIIFVFLIERGEKWSLLYVNAKTTDLTILQTSDCIYNSE